MLQMSLLLFISEIFFSQIPREAFPSHAIENGHYSLTMNDTNFYPKTLFFFFIPLIIFGHIAFLLLLSPALEC